MMAIHWAGKREKWLQHCNYVDIIINNSKFLGFLHFCNQVIAAQRFFEIQ
jgi:hypothetical protein